jgi:hypothetical protein
MTETGSSGDARRGRQGARRPRQQPGRRYRVHFSLTEHELAAVEEAAARAGLARGAYAAQVVLAAAGGTGGGPLTPQREALRELVRASGLAHRIGVNLNQAVARLNATGQRSGDLTPVRPRVPAPRPAARRRRRACPQDDPVTPAQPRPALSRPFPVRQRAAPGRLQATRAAPAMPRTDPGTG